MPRPRIVRHHRDRFMYATERRAVALESAATSPSPVTSDSIIKDVIEGTRCTRHVAGVMVYQLIVEGLIGRAEDGTLFLTKHGLEYLRRGRFDRNPPEEHERPGARRRKRK